MKFPGFIVLLLFAQSLFSQDYNLVVRADSADYTLVIDDSIRFSPVPTRIRISAGNHTFRVERPGIDVGFSRDITKNEVLTLNTEAKGYLTIKKPKSDFRFAEDRNAYIIEANGQTDTLNFSSDFLYRPLDAGNTVVRISAQGYENFTDTLSLDPFFHTEVVPLLNETDSLKLSLISLEESKRRRHVYILSSVVAALGAYTIADYFLMTDRRDVLYTDYQNTVRPEAVRQKYEIYLEEFNRVKKQKERRRLGIVVSGVTIAYLLFAERYSDLSKERHKVRSLNKSISYRSSMDGTYLLTLKLSGNAPAFGIYSTYIITRLY